MTLVNILARGDTCSLKPVFLVDVENFDELRLLEEGGW